MQLPVYARAARGVLTGLWQGSGRAQAQVAKKKRIVYYAAVMTTVLLKGKTDAAAIPIHAGRDL